MSCSRLTRQRRLCRLDAADWPAYDGMPAPVAACWTHLTDTEREQCDAARRRRNKEHGERRLRAEEELRADLVARGLSLPPQPVYEERPCAGQCITRADLRNEDSDSAITGCANCDGQVCILCRDRNHALGTPCTSPSALPDDPDDELPWSGGEVLDHGPNPRGYLNGLVIRLAQVTGERHAAINARINRAVGVSSRVGAEEAVIRRAAAVARDWLAAEEASAPPRRA